MATQTKTNQSSAGRSRRPGETRSQRRGAASANGAHERAQQRLEEQVEAGAERVRDINERVAESAKRAGGMYLDVYEKTLNSVADFEEQVAGATQVEWVASMAHAQANFTRDLAGAYSSAARSLLK